MKIDLNLINRLGKQEIDESIDTALLDLSNTEIIRVNSAHFEGLASLNYVEDLELTGVLIGEMVLPCSISLEEVNYPFEIDIEENLGNFDEILKNNKNSLEILPIMCENIVLEIPMKVVKKGIDITNISGDGWELSDN